MCHKSKAFEKFKEYKTEVEKHHQRRPRRPRRSVEERGNHLASVRHSPLGHALWASSRISSPLWPRPQAFPFSPPARCLASSLPSFPCPFDLFRSPSLFLFPSIPLRRFFSPPLSWLPPFVVWVFDLCGKFGFQISLLARGGSREVLGIWEFRRAQGSAKICPSLCLCLLHLFWRFTFSVAE